MPNTSTRKRRVGRVLILAGVAVWIPYGILLISGNEPDIRYFLPVHLSGVIPGAILARWDWLQTRFSS